jgi:hypothetical protein
LSLTRIYNNARVDAACRRGIQIKVRSVASIRSILKNGLDRTFLDETSGDQPLCHANIRGQGYFHWTMEVSMLTHPTHERLITLGLAGMAKALEEQRQSPDLDALSFEERVGLLVDREAAERDTKRLTTRLKFAALHQSACVENIDWSTPRGIDRAVFARLFGGDRIDRNENLLITGARRGEMIAREPEPSSQPSPPGHHRHRARPSRRERQSPAARGDQIT